MRPVSSANGVNPSSRPLDGSARPPAVRTEQCRTASEYGGIDEWPTVKTRPDRAESLRCSCSEAPPCANNNPFLMSSVCGNTDPNTSVPMIASVPAARLQMIMGNSVRNPKNDTEQCEHPNTSMPVPFALRNVRAVLRSAPTGAPACTRFLYRVSDIAVTEDPESTKNSTE